MIEMVHGSLNWDAECANKISRVKHYGLAMLALEHIETE